MATTLIDPWFEAQAWSETLSAGLDRQLAMRWREQRLAALIEAAVAGSPLYRRRLGHLGRAHPELGDFEPVGKRELMGGFDDWATDRRITRKGVEAFVGDPSHVGQTWLGQYLVWTSSGTSGEPGLFVQDARCLAAYDAIDGVRLRTGGATPWPAVWGLGQRFAYAGATGGHFAGHVSLERMRRLLWSPWSPAVRLFSVMLPLDELAADLERFAPTILITYPSCAAALARMQWCGKLNLRLGEVWCGGEQLSAAQRALLRLAFGCRVRNNYGASEFFSIACECTSGRLHLNDDWVVLEPGDDGVLLTHLANRTQPLLRYRLGDRVRWCEGRCACGSAFPVIEVEGRDDDTLVLRDAAGRGVTLLPLALATAIEEGAQVTQFQLLATADDRLEVRFESGVADPARAFDRTRDALGGYLRTQGLANVRIGRGASPPARDPGSGKLRRVCARLAHHQ